MDQLKQGWLTCGPGVTSGKGSLSVWQVADGGRDGAESIASNEAGISGQKAEHHLGREQKAEPQIG